MRIATLLLLSVLSFAGCASSPPDPKPRAALLVERGQEAEALQLLQAHLVEHPDAVAERRMLVRVLGSTGNLGAARVEVDRLRDQLGEDSPIPWLELGHALELNHDYEAALASYDQASVVAPTDPLGPATAGLRAARWGELEVAIPRLEEALRRDPGDPAVWHALGLARLHSDNSEGAAEAYRAGLQADPHYHANRVGLATIALANGQLEQALIHYDALLKAKQNFADAHLGRSLVLIRLGRFGEAEVAIEKAYRLGADRAVVAAQRRLLRQLRSQR